MSKEINGALLSVLGGICWGLSGSMGQFLFTHEGMDSRWLVPVRLSISGIVLALYCLVRYRGRFFDVWKTKKNAVDMLVYGLAGISFCQFLYFLTIQLSTAGVATILQDLSPIFILAVNCLMTHTRPTIREVEAIVLALVGVALISTHGNFTNMAVSPVAILTGTACAVCVMIYNVEPKKLLEQFPVTILQGWAFLMGGIFFSLVFRVWTIHYVPGILGYIGIAFVVFVGNVFAFTTYITGVHLIGPSKAILYGFSEPLTAAVVSTVFMHSSFGIYDAIGFACVFLMLALISSKKE